VAVGLSSTCPGISSADGVLDGLSSVTAPGVPCDFIVGIVPLAGCLHTEEPHYRKYEWERAVLQLLHQFEPATFGIAIIRAHFFYSETPPVQ